MSNSPIINQFYSNTSFSAEENTSLKSSFLSFGQTFSISISLLKKRFSNLFLPILIWQLILFIGFLFVEGLLIFGISQNIPAGSNLYLPKFDEMYLSKGMGIDVSKEFTNDLINLLQQPSIIGLVGLMVFTAIIYSLIANWIQFKGSIMINDTRAKLFDGNNFVKRFWVLILFFIIESIVFQIVSSIFDIKGSPALNILLGIASFIFSIIITYLDIVAKYISYLYLVEESDFWDSFKAILKNTRKFLVADFLRHLIFDLIVIGTALIGLIVFLGISFGILLPLTDSNILTANTGLLLLALFAIVLFLAIVFIIVLTWISEAFLYVAYYNIRMLELNNIAYEHSFSNSSKIVENSEATQTLEEKLMQNAEEVPSQATKFVENEPSVMQNQEVDQEYNLMNVETMEIKPEPTIINPNHSNIIGLANTKKSNSDKPTE